MQVIGCSEERFEELMAAAGLAKQRAWQHRLAVLRRVWCELSRESLHGHLMFRCAVLLAGLGMYC